MEDTVLCDSVIPLLDGQVVKYIRLHVYKGVQGCLLEHHNSEIELFLCRVLDK